MPLDIKQLSAPGATTGHALLVQADDSLAAGAVATPTSFGANTEALSADKTLTDASETVQFLDPNGADRNVNLPTLSASTPSFIIVNTGTANTLKLQDPTKVVDGWGTIASNVAVRVWSDGVTYRIETLTLRTVPEDLTLGRLSYSFGGNLFTTADAWFKANGATTTSRETSASVAARQTIGAACTADAFSFHIETANTATWEIEKNGATSGTLSFTSATEGFITSDTGFPFSFAAGDELSIQLSSISSIPNECTMEVFCTPDAGSMSTYCWGSNSNGVGLSLAANGDANAQDTSSAFLVEQTLLEACDADNLAWGSAGATTSTDYQLEKNGALSETIDATGAQGTVSGLTTSFIVGDTVSVTPAVVLPGQGTVTLACSGVNGTACRFGGDAANGEFLSRVAIANSGGTSSIAPLTEYPVPAGSIDTIARRSQLASATTYNIVKNGANAQAVNLAAVTDEVVEFTAVSFADLDGLALEQTSGTNPADQTVLVLLKETL